MRTRPFLIRMPRPTRAILAVLAVAVAALAGGALAMNITSPNQFAWNENTGWLNANPTTTAGSGLDVTSSGITGSMWGENVGWISFSCTNRGTCATNSYGVTNDGLGHLAGYAWGENAGWISMSCSNRGTCATNNYGVTIDPSTGIFSGYAWGENIGWINFSCSNDGTCGTSSYLVQTSWRGLNCIPFADCDHDPAFLAVYGDSCPDTEEPSKSIGGTPLSASSPWDFYSVPVPALFAAPDPTTVFRDNVIAGADAQAVFGYFKRAAKTGSTEYEQDLNLNGVKDGLEYDRRINPANPLGPTLGPDGIIGAAEAQKVFAEFKAGLKCTSGPGYRKNGP